MGWEKRGNGRYFYRKRREGRHVVSEYVGGGSDAELLSKLLGITSDKAMTERQALRKQREEIEALDAELERACSLVDALIEATLLANGFHKHKGEWRRKR
jgi:hypothetical protein